MKRLIAVVLGVLFVIVGCSFHHGNRIDLSKVDQILIGSTMKGEITEMFGEPVSKHAYQARDHVIDTWRYHDEIEKGDPILFGTTGHRVTELVLTFKRDVVDRCQIIQTTDSSFNTGTTNSRPCGKDRTRFSKPDSLIYTPDKEAK